MAVTDYALPIKQNDELFRLKLNSILADAYWETRIGDFPPDVYQGLVADPTADLQAWLDVAGERYWPPGNYTTGQLDLSGDTYLRIDPGAVINGKSGGSSVFRAEDTPNVTVESSGGQIVRDSSGTSHAFKVLGTTNFQMRGVELVGGGSAKDALYIGLGSDVALDTLIEQCIIHDARRNGISIVAAYGCEIRGNEIYGATGAPGCGIDVEANTYDQIGRVSIHHNDIHDNLNYGVGGVFGDDIEVYSNRIYDNGNSGIAFGSGGAQFSTGVYRPDVDIRAISVVTAATGKLTVSGIAGLEPGTYFNFGTRSGGVLPVTLQGGGVWVVFSNDGTDITISNTGATAQATFSDAGSGTLTTDPATSAMFIRCYAEGQASNIRVFRNKLYGNNATAGIRQLDITTSVNVEVYENEVDVVGDKSGIYCTFVRRPVVSHNKVKGDLTGATDSNRGIHLSSSSFVEAFGNRVRLIAHEGLNNDSCYGPGLLEANRIYNCGKGGDYPIRLNSLLGWQVCKNIVRCTPAQLATYGIGGTSSVTKSTFDGNDVTGCGSSETNSLLAAATSNVFGVNTLKSGKISRGRSGSKTYDPASIAAGASLQTTVTCTGAVLGDAATASFSLALGGLTISAEVSAANTVTVTFTNNTAGAIDLGSGTLTATAVKILE